MTSRSQCRFSFPPAFPLGYIYSTHMKNITLLSILIVIISTSEASKLKGHFQKLGSHREPQGVTWSGTFSTPVVFFSSFVDPYKPVIMKGALEHVLHPGLSNWTDNFLRKKYGSKMVKIEKSKIENREDPASWIPFKDFLASYQSKDIYLVHSLNNNMEDLVLIPKTLQCGGFQKLIQEAVLWMGSHTASSVLHKDPLDNLLCVLNGRKQVVMIDKTYKEEVEETGFDKERGFSTVDPQRVDFEKFPQLAHVSWHEANLEKGDCLFIPEGWYHQVTSSGYRHLSVNLWFSHLWWFNKTDCNYDISVYKPLEPISTFGFASPNEAYRSKLLSHFKNKGILHRYAFHELLPTSPTEDRANEFFDAINLFPDAALSWSELYAFDIDYILPQFWDLFDIPENQDTHIDRKKTENYDMHSNSASSGDRKVQEDFSKVSEFIATGSSSTESENNLSNDENENSIDSDATNSVQNAESNEQSLPLPDAVSSDTPSLPDDSVDNLVHKSNTHMDGLGKEDVDLNEDIENHDRFRSGESDNEQKAFHHFTESPRSHSGIGEKSPSGSDDEGTGVVDEDQMHLKDEL